MSMQHEVGEILNGADSGLITGEEGPKRSSEERTRGGQSAQPVRASQGTLGLIDMEPIDPIPELERKLMHALHAGISGQLSEGGNLAAETALASFSSSEDPAESLGDKNIRTGEVPESLPHERVAQTRGPANFQAWLETRRKLDGDDAEFVIEYRGDDGQVTQIDLMQMKYEDLPNPIQAQFERRKFPDLNALIRAAPPIRSDQAKSSASRMGPDGPKPARDRRSGAAQQEISAEVEAEDKQARAQDAVDVETYGGARYAPVTGGPGFGISFGGLGRGAQHVARATGRVANETGRAAVNALAGMRDGLGLTSGRQREWIGRHVRSWREERANQALERLARVQAEFDTALRRAHEHPELQKHFRSWNVPRTAATRQRAIKRFHEALVSGNVGEEAVEQIRGLFDRASAVQTEATRAMRRVESAGHNVGDVQRGLAGWLKRMSERAGPLTNLEGESLGETLRQMADVIGRLFEQVVDRIARLTAVRPT